MEATITLTPRHFFQDGREMVWKSEGIVMPTRRAVISERTAYLPDVIRSDYYVRYSKDLPAADVKAGDLLIGWASAPAGSRKPGFRMGKVWLRHYLPGDRVHIEAQFYQELMVWEGQRDAALSIYRRELAR